MTKIVKLKFQMNIFGVWVDFVLFSGFHSQGKVSEKWKKFKVREKSGNFELSQGNFEILEKVREKSGNFITTFHIF